LNRLLISDLPGNELRLIIVPADIADEESDDNVRASSSEFLDTRQRPELALNYDRDIRGGPFGCYPDQLPNNFADENDIPDDGANEDKVEANGFVTIFSSRNRDNEGIVNPNRLADTTVAIELIGQRNRAGTLDGLIASRCEDDEPGHIAGARFQPGWYDFHDHLLQEQPPLSGLFGESVSFVGDLNLDGLPEIIVSAPTNEMDLAENIANFGLNSTHSVARTYTGSIFVFPGADYDADIWRDRAGDDGTSSIPFPGDEAVLGCANGGTCDPRMPIPRCGPLGPTGTFEIFAEDMTDFLGGARGAGDFNLDAVPDMMCGAPLNDRNGNLVDTGALYLLYLRTPVGNIRLEDADDPFARPPMLRIRGESPGDQIGSRQESILDVNGDRIDDIMFSSPSADFILPSPDCQADLFGIGLDANLFSNCRTEGRNDEVFMDDLCKPYDFDNDREIDNADRVVFDCLVAGGGSDCCPVNNGYVGILFGGINRQGDRTISQVGTSDLPGVIFFGTNPGDNAGYDISSAGDFDKDGFGDILITAPGEMVIDENGRERLGVTYLVYGGPHLEEQEAPIELSEIGQRIPGIVFVSPYEAGAPDEAPTDHVGFVGDINNDGFGDIAIGVSRADLVDPQFPQGGGSFPDTGRSPDQGDIYLIYGNNINR
jgi:FG-GAP repeat